VWETDGKLASSSLNIQGFEQPLDADSLNSAKPVFRDVLIENTQLRVLTVPLIIRNSNRVIGVLQAASSLEMVRAIQSVLIWVLLIGAAISMTIAGLASWVSTGARP